MSRQCAFKIFQLVSDSSSSDVPQKVFLIEDELHVAKRQLEGNFNIIGLIGPCSQIQSFLLQTCKQNKINGGEVISQIKNQQPEKFKLQLNQKQVAALFAVSLNKKDPQNQQKQIKTIYLCFITSNSFYYGKPIAQKSIKYLLIRFMGDLCSNIIILYDDKIEKQFSQIGCPYSSSRKKITKMKLVNRTEKDIKIKQIGCDFSKMYQYDPQYTKKLNLKIPIHNKNTIYISKTLQEDFKRAVLKKLRKDQLKLWQLIFQKQINDYQKILLHIDQPLTPQNNKIIKNIINIYKLFKKQLILFGQQCLQQSMRIYFGNNFYFKYWFSQKFEFNIYHYLVQKFKLKPQIQKFKIQGQSQYFSICYNVVFEIYEQLKQPQKLKYSLNYYYQQLGPIVWNIWQQRKQKFKNFIQNFYTQSNAFTMNKDMKEEQMIDIVLFENKVYENQKILISDVNKITLNINKLQQKISIQNFMKYVVSIQVYDLKNSQNSKLICLLLQTNQQNPYSLILFSFSNDELKCICKFKKQKILFNFHTETQTVYILSQKDKEIIYFKIDSLQRMIDQKMKIIKIKNVQITNFAIAIYPNEVIYFLEKGKKELYAVPLQENCQQRIYDRSDGNGERFLTSPGQEKYQYLKAFNEDLYVVLGNSKTIDTYLLNDNGQLKIKYSIKLDSTFLGASVLSEGLNQYLIIFDSNKSKTFVYMNINCNKMVKKQYESKNEFNGNPILDIFYGAKQKFGGYKSYTTKSDNPQQKQLKIIHLINEKPTQNKIKNYLKQLRLQNHIHQYILKVQGAKINKYDENILIQNFFNEVQTRIPIQLCTLQNSNIVPLINGKSENHQFFKKLSISDRSKVLQFGIVEQLLNHQPNKKVIVVSVMGAQSTGKSYLMNRLFGTRFTVSSARTTIGIWLSILKTSQVNYLLLDCQGLFAPYRDLKQQQKLIRVLTSLSDYTLVNQNMSMSNRSLIQLLEGIAQSVKNSLNKQNKSLYKGQMFIVVRDVKSQESEGIQTQFFKSFDAYRKNKSKYIEQLFGGNMILFSMENYEKKQLFLNDLKSIRKYIQQNGRNRPKRTSKQILDSLKVVINQLTCDDSKNFDQQMMKYRIEKSKDDILKTWKNLSKGSLSMEIRGINFVVNQNQIQISDQQFKNESVSCLKILDQLFQDKIIKDNHLKTNEYSKVYNEYNNFIINFFNERFTEVQKKIQQQIQIALSSCAPELKNTEINNLKLSILNHKQKFRLCMQKCSQKSPIINGIQKDCELPCTNRYNHKFDIKSQKQTARVQRDGVNKLIKSKQLTEKQKDDIKMGLDKIENYLQKQLKNNNQIKEFISNLMQIYRQKSNLQLKNNQLQTQIQKINETRIKNNNQKTKFQQHIQKIFQIYGQQEKKIQLPKQNQILKKIKKILQCQISQQVIQINQTIDLNSLIEQLQIFLLIIQKMQQKQKQNIVSNKNVLNNIIEQIQGIQKNVSDFSKQTQKKQKQLNRLTSKINSFKKEKADIVKNFKKVNIQKKQLQLKIAQLKHNNQQLFLNKKQIGILNNNCETIINKVKNQAKNLKQKLQLPILQKNSLQNYIIPTITKLNQKYKQIQIQKIKIQQNQHGTQKLAQQTQNNILNELISQKIISQIQDKQNALIQIQTYLKKLEIKIKFQKSQKNIEDKQRIQQRLKQLTVLSNKKKQHQQIKNMQLALKQEICQLQNLLKIGLVQNSIQLVNFFIKFIRQQSKQQKQKTKDFTQLIQKIKYQISNKIGSNILQQNMIQKLIKIPISQIKKQHQQVKKQQIKYNEMFDQIQYLPQNMQQFQKQADKLLQIIAPLEIIINHHTIINQILYKIVQQFLKNNFALFIKNNNNFAQEIFNQNKDLKIQINQQFKEIVISGQISQSIQEIVCKIVNIKSKLQNSDLQIGINQKYLQFLKDTNVNRKFCKQLKNLISSIFQLANYTEDQLCQFQTQLPIKLSQIIKNNQKYEDWSKFYENIIELSLKIKINKKLQNVIEAKENQFLLINQKIKEIENQIHNCKEKKLNIQKNIQINNKQIKQLQNNLSQTLLYINQLKADRNKNQQLINQKQRQFKLVQKQIQNIKDKLNSLNFKNVNLIAQKNKQQKQIQIFEQKQKQLSIINISQILNISKKWLKQFKQNVNHCQMIKQSKQKINLNNNQISIIEIKQKQLKQVIKNNKIDEVTLKIQKIQEDLQKLNILKLKIKDLGKLKQKLNNLTKRLQQLQTSQKSLCKCLTNHKCEQNCEAGCQNSQCVEGAGHKGSHLCNQPNHKCKQKCQFNEKCNKQCTQKFSHSDQISHNCHTTHSCEKKCQYCDSLCHYSIFQMHEEHICQKQSGCQKMCLLCNNKCSSPHHDHDKTADTVEFWQQNKETKQRKKVPRKFHYCNRQHDCGENCCQKGTCAYKYQNREKKWNKKGVQRTYIYTEQTVTKEICKKKIQKGKLKHNEGQCNCNSKHTCEIRCPDCGSLCQLPIGHKEKHKTQHRNQQQLIYADQEQNRQIIVGEIGKDFVFNVGDTSQPTRCHGSCQAKGRGHYHLIQCQGGKKCLATTHQTGVKHSNLKYYPYIEKRYDMVLCKIYWELHNFQMPTYKQQFDLCNFVCPANHQRKQQYYCTKLAWHTVSNKMTDHTFQCSQEHKPIDFKNIQICFLIDATASMNRFISQCKDTIKQIIKKASSSKNKQIGIKFGIVGYRDHEMAGSKFVMSCLELFDKKQAQLKKLPLKPFHKELISQRQFILTLKQLQKKYQQKRSSQNLRQQFNEKQLFILDYHFPFHFDLQSSQDMVSPIKLLKLLNPLRMLLQALTSSRPQTQSLNKKLLINQMLQQLKQSKLQLLQQLQQQKQNKQNQKIIESNNFDSAQKTLQFLDKLKADGGGDPPQAVLDGMDAICKLNWSKQKNVLRYVFHIFDAPPHGRIYAQNNGDRYPDGCPCGKTHQLIIQKINSTILNLNYIMYPLTERVNTTMNLFAGSGLKFQKKYINKDQPQDFGVHVTQLICQKIEQNQIMINKSHEY